MLLYNLLYSLILRYALPYSFILSITPLYASCTPLYSIILLYTPSYSFNSFQLPYMLHYSPLYSLILLIVTTLYFPILLYTHLTKDTTATLYDPCFNSVILSYTPLYCIIIFCTLLYYFIFCYTPLYSHLLFFPLHIFIVFASISILYLPMSFFFCSFPPVSSSRHHLCLHPRFFFSPSSFHLHTNITSPILLPYANGIVSFAQAFVADHLK